MPADHLPADVALARASARTPPAAARAADRRSPARWPPRPGRRPPPISGLACRNAHCPVRVPQPGPESAGGRAAGAGRHHLHHQSGTGRARSRRAVPATSCRSGRGRPQLARRVRRRRWPARPPEAQPRASEPHSQPGRGGDGRRHRRRNSVSRSVKPAPARTMPAAPQQAPSAQEHHPQLLVQAERPPDGVQPGTAGPIARGQVGQLGHCRPCCAPARRRCAARSRNTPPRPAAARTPRGSGSRRWSCVLITRVSGSIDGPAGQFGADAAARSPGWRRRAAR